MLILQRERVAIWGSAGWADHWPQVHSDSTTWKCGTCQLCGHHKVHSNRARKIHPRLSSTSLPVHLVTKANRTSIRSRPKRVAENLSRFLAKTKHKNHSNCHSINTEGLHPSFIILRLMQMEGKRQWVEGKSNQLDGKSAYNPSFWLTCPSLSPIIDLEPSLLKEIIRKKP